MNRWIIIALVLATGTLVAQTPILPAQEQGAEGSGVTAPLGAQAGQPAGPMSPDVTPDVETETETPPNLPPTPKRASAGGLTRTQALIGSLTIFMLAVFVGFEVITKVPPTLHTPLMSGSNAISGITIVGAILITGVSFGVSSFFGFLALVLATVNVVGGFLVTHRMLAMFKKR